MLRATAPADIADLLTPNESSPAHAYAAHRDKAYKGDLQATNACLKVCAHLASMHGLYQPAVSALNIHNSMMIDATPRQTSTDRIEAALNALIEDGKRTAALKAANGKEPAEDVQVVEVPMREPTDEEIDAAVFELVAHMREQLRRAEMDDSEAAVREACKRSIPHRPCPSCCASATRCSARCPT